MRYHRTAKLKIPTMATPAAVKHIMRGIRFVRMHIIWNDKIMEIGTRVSIVVGALQSTVLHTHTHTKERPICMELRVWLANYYTVAQQETIEMNDDDSPWLIWLVLEWIIIIMTPNYFIQNTNSIYQCVLGCIKENTGISTATSKLTEISEKRQH